MKKITFLVIFLVYFSLVMADETLTITTYYPSPYGSYRELQWGNIPNSRGRLGADQGASIELGGSGTPYIDFSNDMSVNYDARIILLGNDQLAFQGITRLNACTGVQYFGGVTMCPSCYYVSSFEATASPSGGMVCCMIDNPPAGSGC